MRRSPPEQIATALARRERLLDAVVGTMDAAGVEALVFPTMLCPATPLPGVIDPDFVCAGAPPMPFSFGGDSILIASLAGLPEVTVPAGYTADGAPIAVSFLGRPFSEATLIRLAYAFEQATLARRPPAFAGAQ
ncbi:MAG: amidase family protein [Thermodesulfobacteriota bacterium]